MIYLASPYTHPNAEIQAKRYQETLQIVTKMFGQGYHVLNPIVYGYWIIQSGSKGDWQTWANFDTVILNLCDQFWVLKLDGWDKSVGIAAEIKIAKSLGRDIVFVEPSDWR